MKASELKPGDLLTVCGVEWRVTNVALAHGCVWFSRGDDGFRFSLEEVDTMLANGATVRRDGPIVVEGTVDMKFGHMLNTCGRLGNAVLNAGWPEGTKVKITVEKL